MQTLTYTLRMVRDGSVTYPGEERPITSAEDALPLLRAYFKDLDREHAIALAIDNRGMVIGLNVVSIGCLDASIVHPREVFKFAILANAASLILAHNHPSGDPEPSDADRYLTKTLTEAGKLLSIDLLDHIIIGHGDSWRRVSLL